MTLKGKSVVITRPKHQAGDLAEIVTRLGGRPRIVPTVEIGPVSNLEDVKKPLSLIASGKADVIIFMSQNGVLSFITLSEKLGLKDDALKSLSRMQVVAIGSKTRKRLEEQGVRVDLTPADHSSNGLAETLSRLDLGGKVIAIPRTDRPTDYLTKKLAGRSAEIVQFPIYETRLPADRTEVLNLIEDILNGRVDIITFTSSATARNLFHIAEEHRLADQLRNMLNEKVVVASIGPVTKSTLESLGVNVHVTPQEYTIETMMEALDTYLENKVNEDLDATDRHLLDELQKAIPLTKRPWTEIGKRLGLSGEEVLARLIRLSEREVVRKLGPIIDAKKVGLKASTRGGMKVPSENIPKVVDVINSYDEVSHNYERNHEYNVWFTLTAPNQDDLTRILQEISMKTGVSEEDTLNLPTERFFKIKANFRIGEK
ncbi:MAG: uroporphyrinogen-III synthase [Nitrososphaerales archaeon]